MIVINLIAGPSAGKSTIGPGMFWWAKRNRVNIEYVTEYAKDQVWEGRLGILKNQLYIFAKQYQKQERVREHVDYIITDTSLLYSLMYAPSDYFSSFPALVKQVYDSYENVNVFVHRPPKDAYSTVGRLQTYDEAIEKDFEARALVMKHSILHAEINAGDDPEVAWNIIMKKINRSE